VVSASLGIAVGHADRTAEELLLEADAAMYSAKAHGRGLRRMFTSELRSGAESRLRLESDLREAMAQEQFVLHYQPVVDITRNVVAGVEALVRWDHADGLRMPDTFIPVAEASGLIVPLGTWVLEEACRQNAAWTAEGLVLDVAVNLSVRQLAHAAVTATLHDVLARTGLAPAQLMVEITESAVMEDADAALAALSSIAALGSGIAIDDFGTGYSSLVYLKRYPIHALKVDRTFVSGIGRNVDDDAIVASIVNLARAVGAVCIAEGVETAQQLTALRELGCQFAQGYLFARPVPASQLPPRS
jgi:EAL domain-containing protein (putative c-di-GMP-specific phosphodiesterase class I)